MNNELDIMRENLSKISATWFVSFCYFYNYDHSYQEWLGHSTYTTTADIYSHLNYTSKLNIAGVLSDVFGGEKLPQDNTQNRNIAKILEGLVSESEENSDNSGLLEKSEEEFLDEEDNDGFIYEVKKQKSKRKSDIEM